jgi:hypothetical protein
MNSNWHLTGYNLQEQQRLLARRMTSGYQSPNAALDYPQPSDLTTWQGWQSKVLAPIYVDCGSLLASLDPQLQPPVNGENALYLPYQGAPPSIQIQPSISISQDSACFQAQGGQPPYIQAPEVISWEPNGFTTVTRLPNPPVLRAGTNSSTPAKSRPPKDNLWLTIPTGGPGRRSPSATSASDSHTPVTPTSSHSGHSPSSIRPSPGKPPKPAHPPGKPQPKSNRVPYTWVSYTPCHCAERLCR